MVTMETGYGDNGDGDMVTMETDNGDGDMLRYYDRKHQALAH